MATPIEVVVFISLKWLKLQSTNFVKFVRREIGEIVSSLLDKTILPASQTVANAQIVPKICQG